MRDNNNNNKSVSNTPYLISAGTLKLKFVGVPTNIFVHHEISLLVIISCLSFYSNIKNYGFHCNG